MGVTLHYRGRIKDSALLETFEDRIVDLALEVGGFAKLWRSRSETKPDRMVRGVALDLVPGLETVSLLVSPEGWLMPLTSIEEAEEAPFDEGPWVSVKTQFGPIEGHVMLVELLDTLKKEFFPDLDVSDEGGYWETRDLAGLRARIGTVNRALDAFGKALAKDRLSPEAAEDPEILAAHVARLAERVRRTLLRPPEHPPVRFADDEFTADNLGFGSEAQWDASYKEQIRKQERLHRAIEEREMRGDNTRDAFEGAMRDEGIIGLPGEEEPETEDDGDRDWDLPEPDDAETEAAGEDAEAAEPEPGEEDDDTGAGAPEGGADVAARRRARRERDFRHPLMKRAHELTLEAMRLPERKGAAPGGPVDVLVHGVMEMSGGIAQVFFAYDPEEEEDTPYGLDLVQLKRALRGASFARGALSPARHAEAIDEKTFARFRDEIAAIESGLHKEVARLRKKLGGGPAGG